jgi:hypothetical protein
LSNAFRSGGNGSYLTFDGWTVLSWRERDPAYSNISIRPGVDETGQDTQNKVVVVIQDGVGTDLDGKDGSKKPQPFDYPRFAMRIVSIC